MSSKTVAEAVEEVSWDIIVPIKEDKLQKMPVPDLKDTYILAKILSYYGF